MSKATGFFTGIDLGSTMTKVLFINGEGQVVARLHGATGAEHRRLANRVMTQALEYPRLDKRRSLVRIL